MTFRPDKPIFSRAVCNDRIKKIWVNLVGDNLGAGVTYAFVRLTHGGTNYLRACTGSNALVAYNLTGTDNRPRVANIQAGINAPNVSQTMSENTDFAMRALQAGPWELVIEHGPTASGPNAKLLLEGLDDIELVVAHEASTIQ